MRRVIQKLGMRKEASASLIQHGQDDCLPLLSLLTVFIWLRIHASSLVCISFPPGHGRMASRGSRDWSQQFPWKGDHFACEGGWSQQTVWFHTLSCHFICESCCQKDSAPLCHWQWLCSSVRIQPQNSDYANDGANTFKLYTQRGNSNIQKLLLSMKCMILTYYLEII